MKYWYQKPNPAIAGYIRTVLVLDGSAEADPGQLPMYTNGMSAFLCRTEKDVSGNEQVLQLSLVGHSIPDDHLKTSNDTSILIYFFKPFALTTIFNLPAASLKDEPVEMENWDAHKANALKTQLAYAKSTDQKTEIFDHLLAHLLEQNKRDCEVIQYATDQIMLNPGIEILTAVQNTLKINERTFQRIFKKYVGITPNQYRRICQFQVSFEQLSTKNFDKLTDIAYDNGFADQSHFIRSFREFTRITPNDYLKSGLKGKKQ